jgi:hypothetical protein
MQRFVDRQHLSLSVQQFVHRDDKADWIPHWQVIIDLCYPFKNSLPCYFMHELLSTLYHLLISLFGFGYFIFDFRQSLIKALNSQPS